MKYIFIGGFAILIGTIFGILINIMNKRNIQEYKEEIPMKVKMYFYIIMVSIICGSVFVAEQYIF